MTQSQAVLQFGPLRRHFPLDRAVATDYLSNDRVTQVKRELIVHKI